MTGWFQTRDQDEVEKMFQQLESLLAVTELPTSSGGRRVASPDEFMFMGTNGGDPQFKHRDTRNYVSVQGNVLVVRGESYDNFV